MYKERTFFSVCLQIQIFESLLLNIILCNLYEYKKSMSLLFWTLQVCKLLLLLLLLPVPRDKPNKFFRSVRSSLHSGQQLNCFRYAALFIQILLPWTTAWWGTQQQEFIHVFRSLMLHLETSISAVAAVPDTCDPVFGTKRSLLPNTSATRGKHHNNVSVNYLTMDSIHTSQWWTVWRQITCNTIGMISIHFVMFKSVMGRKKEGKKPDLLQHHLYPKPASHPSVPRRHRRRADQGSMTHRTVLPVDMSGNQVVITPLTTTNVITLTLQNTSTMERGGRFCDVHAASLSSYHFHVSWMHQVGLIAQNVPNLNVLVSGWGDQASFDLAAQVQTCRCDEINFHCTVNVVHLK